jgi:predicted nucleotidyltransferase
MAASDHPNLNPNLVLPVGTRIVTRVEAKTDAARAQRPVGAVAEIIAVPPDEFHSYRVRFADGAEASLRRRDFSIWSQYREDATAGPDPLVDRELFARHVILRCIVGSRAYGLDGPGSDTDRRGIYLPPADLHWSLYGVPEQIEDHERQECYWELQKFLDLALKANPNVLECLWTPLVEHATPLAEELLAMRTVFLSKLVYQTYNGYVMGQFKKLEQDVRTRGEVRWKHVMHLTRLLLSGIALLRDGTVIVRVEEHRDRLLAVREGRVPWNEIDTWRLELHRDLDDAYAATRLPERPDYDAANRFLLKARRSATQIGAATP